MSRRKKQPVTLDYVFLGASLPTGLYGESHGTAGTITAMDDHARLFANSAEVEQAAITFNDLLGLNIDDLQYVDFWIERPTGDTPEMDNFQIDIGVGSAAAADPRTVAERALFTIDADSYAININTDDGTHDNTVSTGIDIAPDVVTQFRLDFRTGIQQVMGADSKAGKGAVQFSVSNSEGQLTPVKTPGRYMDMSAYSGGLQPIVQLSSDESGDVSIRVHRIRIQLLTWG